MMKTRLTVILLIAGLLSIVQSKADLLGEFTFEGDSLNASSVDPDLTISSLSYVGDFGGTLSFVDGNPSAPNRGYSNASNWPTDALTEDDYYAFTITANPGYLVDLDAIVFDHRRSFSSPRQWLIYYDFGLGFTASGKWSLYGKWVGNPM